MTSPLRFALLTLAGMIIVQAAWIFAVPPYHAIDEFDHAYRAAGVASGQWVLTEATPNGRGMSVVVPPGMVEGASGQCDSLPYTEPGNCHPVDELQDGRVVVATSAAQYNPLFYWVIGTAAKPFDGATADYVMRGLSALLCALAVALAAFCLGLMRAGPWLQFGLVASLTPMLMYTTVVPAPNSIEIVTALVCWCALLAVGSERLDPSWERRLVWVAGVAAAVTVIPRALGPLWLVLIGAVLALFVGRARLAEVVRAHRNPVLVGVALVVVATVGSSLWSTFAGLFGVSPDVLDESDPVSTGDAMFPVLWVLQIIAAFPFRNSPAPAPVYALYVVVVAAILLAGLRRGQLRERLAIVLAVVLTITVPVLLTLATAQSQGPIWQGRYLLPLVVGTLLMCGIAVDRRASRSSRTVLLLGVGSLLVTAAHVWSVVGVALFEAGRPETRANAGWVGLPVWALGAVLALGCVLLLVSPVREALARAPRASLDGVP